MGDFGSLDPGSNPGGARFLMKNLINGLIEILWKGGSVKAEPYWIDSSNP